MDEQKIIAAIEETLSKLLPKQPGPLEKLYEGARYLVFAPSKRIRPLFTIAVSSLFNVSIAQALYPACALELIHTYSLIHDDLPCMDNDDMRRGQPALHKVYDEAIALLIGDFLLTLSFEVLANAPDLSSDQKLTLIQILSEYAGGKGMVGGQLMDLEKSVPAHEIHKYKTAALFVSAFRFGAILGNSSKKKKDQLTQAGEKVGLLFQLVDDLIDDDCLNIEESLLTAKRLYKEIYSLVEKEGLVAILINKIFNSIPQTKLDPKFACL